MSYHVLGDVRIDTRGDQLWHGTNHTNGFLMRNADGRVASIETACPWAPRVASSLWANEDYIPYGLGLFTVPPATGTVTENRFSVGALSFVTGAATVGGAAFAGILKFEQSQQTGNPAANYGVPIYGKATRIAEGVVGFKHSMKLPDTINPTTIAAQAVLYKNWLKGSREATDAAAVEFYADWQLKTVGAAAVGSTLFLEYDLISGVPIVIAGNRTAGVLPTATAGSIIVAEALVWEPENTAVYFSLTARAGGLN